ncbi:MAG: helix-turn-helix transcriptional regulator [Kangiella sp.]|nr:helix-turn-helix transcriptional regulator [Kangiella sp.]
MSTEAPIPKRIKELRTQKGWSQTKLGVEIGLDEGTASARINRYEKGVHVPDYSTLKKLAAVLEVPVFYFWVEDGELERVKSMIKTF